MSLDEKVRTESILADPERRVERMRQLMERQGYEPTDEELRHLRIIAEANASVLAGASAQPEKPSFFTRLRRRLGLGLLAASLLVPGAARATQLAPLGAAHANGLYGSVWRDRTQLRNPYSTTLTGDICVVPRGHSYPDDAVCEAYSLPPGTTTVYDDLWGQLIENDGAGTVWVVPDDGQEDPILFSSVFNKNGDAEFGSTSQVLTPDDYAAAGTTLGTILSPEGYRDSPFVATGPDGATIQWTYTNSAGGNKVTVTASYVPNTTFQYTGGVQQLLGFDPEPNASLDARILEGSARVFASSNNNTSNDNAIRKFREYTSIPAGDVAIQYVNHWLPKGRFYLSNQEIRAMINGGQGTRSYAHDMAEILINADGAADYFGSVDNLEQWLLDQVDGDLPNGEFYHAFDPVVWDNDAYGDPNFRVYGEPSGNPIDFHLGESDIQALYTLISGINQNGEPIDGFLWHYVKNNPSLYGGTVGGVPDMSYNPTWNTQDPN